MFKKDQPIARAGIQPRSLKSIIHRENDMKARIGYLDDDEGNLTKVVITDLPIRTLHRSDGFSEPEVFALVLTEEIEQAIKAQ